MEEETAKITLTCKGKRCTAKIVVRKQIKITIERRNMLVQHARVCED